MSARNRKPTHSSGEETRPTPPPPRTRARPPPEESPYSWGCFLTCSFIVAVCVGTFSLYYFPGVRKYYGIQRDITLKWWQRSIIYQVYPRSFQDSNGDGIGDIQGIISRLDYFTYIGVEAIWLNPIYRSPMIDHGYDVSDYIDIDPIFGTMADFEKLVEKAHEIGIKVIMDFIPNHTSDKHAWFEKSRTQRNGGQYKDYYVWADGRIEKNGTVEPPNNWVSVFGGSMWEWDDARGQYYLHQFVKQQPDLNFRNSRVQQEIKDAFMFWLEKGVDGFRVDALRHMYEVKDLSLTEPVIEGSDRQPDEYEHYEHPHTQDMKETHQVVRDWRQMFDEFEERTGKEIFMVVEVLAPAHVALPYYHSGASFPFNFNLQFLNRSCDGYCIKELVDSWLQHMPEKKWPNWVLGSHDVPRVSANMGEVYARALNMLLLTLPGTPTTYYGEELAMRSVHVPYEDTQDPFAKNMGPERFEAVTRDPSRAPMQWSDAMHAGFSAGPRTWLPVHPDYKTNNVKAQMNAESQTSTLQLYRQLAELRRIQSFSRGGFQYALVNKNIFSFVRYFEWEPAHLVALNLGDSPSSDDYREYKTELPPSGVHAPYRGYVVANTGEMRDPNLKITGVVSFENITLYPGEGVIIRYWPKMAYL